MKAKVELHIVVDEDGVKGVQIIGPSEVHVEGHHMYFRIRHLIPELDQEIRRLLQDKQINGEKKLEEGTEH
jgi:hypothetical protein